MSWFEFLPHLTVRFRSLRWIKVGHLPGYIMFFFIDETETSPLNSTVPNIKEKSNKEIIRSYNCDICQKVLSSKGNLSKHKLLHSGEKPHQCHLCPAQVSKVTTNLIIFVQLIF